MESRFAEPSVLILVSLASGPKHGYELMKELETKSGGIYKASAGAIYPALQQLEDEGMVTSDAAACCACAAVPTHSDRPRATRLTALILETAPIGIAIRSPSLFSEHDAVRHARTTRRQPCGPDCAASSLRRPPFGCAKGGGHTRRYQSVLIHTDLTFRYSSTCCTPDSRP